MLIDKPSPLVSAQSWAIFDMKNKSFLFGKNEKEKREIASLTKIMTCYCVLNILKDLDLDENNHKVIISDQAARIIGTSADV